MKTFNRVLGLLVAVALAVGGVILIIEIAAAQLGGGPVLVEWRNWYQSLRTTAWEDARIPLVATLLFTGTILALQLVPRRPSTLTVVQSPQFDLAVRRRFLERQVAASAGRVDGIAKARAVCSRRKLTVTADTYRADPSGLQATVDHVVRTELTRLDITNPPAVDVRLRSQR